MSGGPKLTPILTFGMTGCLGRNRQFIEQLSSWLRHVESWVLQLENVMNGKALTGKPGETERSQRLTCRNFILRPVFACSTKIMVIIRFFDSQVGTHDGFAFFGQVGSWVFFYIPDFGGSVFQAEYVNSEVPRFKKKTVSIRHPPVIPWGERRCFFLESSSYGPKLTTSRGL